jgi:phosphatidylserine/phosphatidylglycerophosphate/cardiolipin synthase-like enzyme
MKTLLLAIAIAGSLMTHDACALQPALPVVPFAASGTIQYAFAPDHHADDMIIAAIVAARAQVLVQAYSFTHHRIADALIGAHNRGIEVVVLVDNEQMRSNDPGAIRDLVRANVPLLHDSDHAAAHNKIIVIDAGRPDCAVITGSYNFTYAAQHRNAENALVLRGNPPLCEAYRNNWLHHRAHSLPQRR